MTPDGLTTLAERARAEHMTIIGVAVTPWHLAPKKVREAWVATVALVLSATRKGAEHVD